MVGQVAMSVVLRNHAERRQVVDRNRKEPVDLRRVQRHRQHPVRPGRDEQIRALTLEQVNAAFRKWIDPKKALTVGAGSFSAARAKATEKVQK